MGTHRTYVMRFELTDGYYTCQFVEDYTGLIELEEVKEYAEKIARKDLKIKCVDDVYLKQ